MFTANEKVVCVNDTIAPNKLEEAKTFSSLPKKGQVYNVDHVTVLGENRAMVHVTGIQGPKIEIEGQILERGFHPRRFRRIQDIREEIQEEEALEAANAELQLLSQPQGEPCFQEL